MVYDSAQLIAALQFLLIQLSLLAVAAAVAYGAGRRLVPDGAAVVRMSAGLALLAATFFLLALCGVFVLLPMVAITVVTGVSALAPIPRFRRLDRTFCFAAVVTFLPLALLALRPAIAFDETMYHLPFTRAVAESGRLDFHPTLRHPVFPQAEELLAVPLYRAGGDSAAHLLSLLECTLVVGLIVEWSAVRSRAAGVLAAALFLGSPLVVQLATTHYVDMALTLFVASGFYALDRATDGSRRWLALSGLFFGTACSTKYLGLFFAAAAALIVVAAPSLRRRTALFVVVLVVTLLPTYCWIAASTGNPIFPFASSLFGSTSWDTPAEVARNTSERLVNLVRLPWSVTFDRARAGLQPPLSPLLVLLVIALAAAARCDTRARVVVAVGATFLVAFTALPQDSRYLVPLIPLVAAPAAIWLARRYPLGETKLAIVVVAVLLPGPAYAVYRLSHGGAGMTPEARRELVERAVPEYRALERAPAGAVYACGGEQLKGLTHAEMFGDLNGPYAYNRIVYGHTAPQLAAELRALRVRSLIVTPACASVDVASSDFRQLYSDQYARLYEVGPIRESSPAEQNGRDLAKSVTR